MKYCCAIVSIGVFVLMTGCTTTAWIQKNFDAVKPGMDTVSVLFPQIEFSERVGEVNKLKSGSSIFVSKNVAEAVKELVDRGKFIPKAAVIADDSVVLDQWFRSYSSKSMASFKTIKDSLAAPGETKILPVGQEILSLIDRLPSKYFIFIAGVGYRFSKATKQYAFEQEQIYRMFYDRPNMTKNQYYGLKLLFALVEVKSKEVLWYTYNGDENSQYDPLVKEEVQQLCSALLLQK